MLHQIIFFTAEDRNINVYEPLYPLGSLLICPVRQMLHWCNIF